MSSHRKGTICSAVSDRIEVPVACAFDRSFSQCDPEMLIENPANFVASTVCESTPRKLRLSFYMDSSIGRKDVDGQRVPCDRARLAGLGYLLCRPVINQRTAHFSRPMEGNDLDCTNR